MLRAARQVALGAAVAWTMICLPDCSSRFVSEASEGGSPNAGASAAGEGGLAVNPGGGGQQSVAGAGGDDTETVAGGASGGGSGSVGEGGSVDVPGAGASDCESELLTNGGFDALSSGWSQLAEPARGLILHRSSDVLVDLGHAPVSPEYVLLLGGVDLDKSSVTQEIAVPDAALVLAVSFYLHIDTEEDETQVWDSMAMQLNTGSSQSVPIATYSNLDSNDDWELVSFLLDATPYRGKSFNFVLSSETDGHGDTTFLLDSFSIVAKVCSD